MLQLPPCVVRRASCVVRARVRVARTPQEEIISSVSAGGPVEGRICRHLRDGLIEFCFPKPWDQFAPYGVEPACPPLCECYIDTIVYVDSWEAGKSLVGATRGKKQDRYE